MKLPMDLSGLLTLLNSLGILAVVFYAGKFAGRIETLEKNDIARADHKTDIALIQLDLRNVVKQLDNLHGDIKGMRDGWVEFETSVLKRKLAAETPFVGIREIIER